MITHDTISKTELWHKLRHREIILSGNRQLKIYGTLHCTSGKKMLRQNRVFFTSEQEATELGFRPCGHCLHTHYLHWKNELI